MQKMRRGRKKRKLQNERKIKLRKKEKSIFKIETAESF